jgi:hypothetical protein
MLPANAKRHSLGGAAGEFRVKQRIQLSAVADGERGIEGAGEIGGVAVFHPVLFSKPAFCKPAFCKPAFCKPSRPGRLVPRGADPEARQPII